MSKAIVNLGLICLMATCAWAGRSEDPRDDALPRPTDGGADAAILSPDQLPDIVAMEISGWAPIDPVADRYLGIEDAAYEPDLIRIALEFSGSAHARCSALPSST